jgi:transcriptional regulator
MSDIDVKLTPKQEAIGILQEQGLKGTEIAQALNITSGRVSQVQSTLKKMGLTGNVKRYKTALKAHDKILKTFADSDLDNLPKALKISDVNTCIDRVLDRVDPAVKQSMNLNINADISPVDLSTYLNNNK